MANRNHFRFKRGKTEIEGSEGNWAVIGLAYLNTILPWLLKVLMAVVATKKVALAVAKILSG